MQIIARISNSILFLFITLSVAAQTSDEWTWMFGNNTSGIPSYGTKGVPAIGNAPTGIYETACWTDLNGDLWFYGGGMRHDMWKYDVSSNLWTWMHGPGTPSSSPVYGVQGVFGPNVLPGETDAGLQATWTDNNGDFWLFCNSGGSIMNNNSMWKYDVSLNQWAWIHGNIPYSLGTLGVADPMNNPAAYESPTSWVADDGTFWLYEGFSGRMWQFDPVSNEWTWMHGSCPSPLSMVFCTPGNLGVLGVYAPGNEPPSGHSFRSWKSDDGTFYLFKSQAMWQFDPSINQWRRVSEANSASATFGATCTFSAWNHPGEQDFEQRATWKDGCNRFYSYDGRYGYLWCFDPAINQFAKVWESSWASGNSNANATTLFNYGTLGVSSATNEPGLCYGEPSWTDNDGNFWLLSDNNVIRNSLWRFVPDFGCLGGPISANFSASPNQGCAPLTVDFAPQNVSGGLSYWWDFGVASVTNDTSTLSTPSYTFTTAGTYSVQLIMSGVSNCGSGTDTTEITIVVTDPPQLNATSDTSICPGESVTLAASGANTYVWSPSLGLNTVSGAFVQATPSISTMYYVTGTVAGCSVTDSVEVAIIAPPQLLSADEVLCEGDTAELIVSGADTYVWSPALGLNTTTGSNVLANPTNTTIYTVVGSDISSGCSSTEQVMVTVESPEVTVNSVTICMNDPAASGTLIANGADVYVWSPPTGLSSTVGSSVISTTAVTTVYSVIGTTLSGCVDTSEAIVTVVPSFDVSVNSAEICAGETATLSVNGANSYTWSPSDGLNLVVGTEVISTPAETIVYTVIGHVDNCVDTAFATVTVYPLPIANASANPNPISSSEPQVLLSTEAMGNGVAWYYEGSLISNLVEFTHHFQGAQPGEHQLQLVLTNHLGCSDTLWITLFIQEDLIFYVPNAFSPDGNEFNPVFQPVISSGIDASSYSFTIFNRWGEVVFATRDVNDYWDGTYNGEKCADGTYTWKLKFGSKYNEATFEHVGHVTLLK